MRQFLLALTKSIFEKEFIFFKVFLSDVIYKHFENQNNHLN